MANRTPEGGAGQTEPHKIERIVAFDYLRSLGVLLVFLHHTLLAYVTFGFLNPENPTKTFSPIVDSAKWAGFDIIVLLNDTFFMPLLFFVSGLFVWRSLERKGAARAGPASERNLLRRLGRTPPNVVTGVQYPF